MTQRAYMLILLLALLIFSCEQFYQDDFQLNAPSEERITVNFPGLVEFEIIQTVTPDDRGITNEVANTFVISNELDQSLNRLQFGINLFDSTDRFENDLIVSYVDSIRRPLGPFEVSAEKIFNNSLSQPLTAEMIDIFIIDQDVQATHPFSGIYTGEAFYYNTGDTTPSSISYVRGAIDYRGDLTLRASGNNVTEYHINGRVSTSGQFIGQLTSSTTSGPKGGLKNEPDTVVLLQNDSLSMALIAGDSGPDSLDSITLVLTRD